MPNWSLNKHAVKGKTEDILAFIRYDTTNDAKLYEKQAKLQKQKYGVVGWNEYNKEHFSCKWDCEVEDIEQHTENGITTITFTTRTPWHLPDKWCRTLQEMFPKLTFFISAEEETGYYLFFKNYKDDEEHDYLDESSYDSWCNAIAKMNQDFIDYVENF